MPLAIGVPLVAGRDFTDADRADKAPVVIISESIARRMFGSRDAVDRNLMWTDPVMQFIGLSTAGRRIVGIAADVDDENVVPGPAMTVYHPFEQEIGGGRLFVHAKGDPYALVAPITSIIQGLKPEQPVERAATLEDVRAEVLAPDRLNAMMFGGFAGVALMIAVVGVAGVLAFSVSARTREFGVRLAIGSSPRHLLVGVLRQGAAIAGIGIVAGVLGGLTIIPLTPIPSSVRLRPTPESSRSSGWRNVTWTQGIRGSQWVVARGGRWRGWRWYCSLARARLRRRRRHCRAS